MAGAVQMQRANSDCLFRLSRCLDSANGHLGILFRIILWLMQKTNYVQLTDATGKCEKYNCGAGR